MWYLKFWDLFNRKTTQPVADPENLEAQLTGLNFTNMRNCWFDFDSAKSNSTQYNSTLFAWKFKDFSKEKLKKQKLKVLV